MPSMGGWRVASPGFSNDRAVYTHQKPCWIVGVDVDDELFVGVLISTHRIRRGDHTISANNAEITPRPRTPHPRDETIAGYATSYQPSTRVVSNSLPPIPRRDDGVKRLYRQVPNRPRGLAPQGRRGQPRPAQVGVSPARPRARRLAPERRGQVLDWAPDCETLSRTPLTAGTAGTAQAADGVRGGAHWSQLLPRAAERGWPLRVRVWRPALLDSWAHHCPPLLWR